MNPKLKPHLEEIRKISKPIAELSPMGVAKLVQVMVNSDGALVDDGMPHGNVAVVRAIETGRAMAVFGSALEMRRFAKRHGLNVQVMQ